MSTVLVTGSSGFIGKNLCARLSQEKNIKVLVFDRHNTSKDLEAVIKKSDFIFHIAGVNRPKDESEFKTGNADLTQSILDLLAKHKKKTPILITSSIQAGLDNPYGKSKQAAEESVKAWAATSKAPAYIFRLPNVFGKWSRPNYNSVVATFCHNIAHGLDITISDPKAVLTLTYIDDVVNDFIAAMQGAKKAEKDGFCHVSRTFSVSLQELADTLYSFRDSRKTILFPSLDTFKRFLYATYTSHFDEKDFSYQLDMKRDDRGWLAEFIKSESFGQVFVSRTKPGITRGQHWHHTKVEKFLVVSGEGTIKFRLFNDTKVLSYKVSGEKLTVLDIPTGYVHSITNTGKDDLITIFWADEIFNPGSPDTHYEEV